MELVPFRPEHLAGIEPPAMTPEQLACFRRRYRPRGPAWTGIEAGRVLGCGGIIVNDGVGTGWVVLSRPVNAVAVHRAVLRALRDASRTGDLQRIEAATLTAWPAGCRWLERLGFRLERIEGEYRRYAR